MLRKLFQAMFLLAQLFHDALHSSSMTGIFAATLALAAINRRLLTDPQGRHASRYVLAWHYGALLFVAVLSALIALRANLPAA